MNEYDSNRISDIVKDIGYEKSKDQNNVKRVFLQSMSLKVEKQDMKQW